MEPRSSVDSDRPKRLTELTKCLPVMFVIAVIVVEYVTYAFYHCVPMLQLEKDLQRRDNVMFQRGKHHLIWFLIFSTMLLICYFRSIIQSPGTVPDTPEWQYTGDQAEPTSLLLHETKSTGQRRHCKWCAKYKPDRCHHCRVCRMCILKMDHHCPWIYNCVGWGNHKFFILLLLYTFFTTQLIVWTMFESVKRAVDEDIEFFDMFLLLFAETLAAFLAILVTVFFAFHLWLMVKAMTTIEFCEKSVKKVGYSTSVYHRGLFGDIQEVFGRNPLLWFIPINDHTGDGLSFINDGTRLTVDMDVGRQLARQQPRRGREEAPTTDGILHDQLNESLIEPPPATQQDLPGQ